METVSRSVDRIESRVKLIIAKSLNKKPEDIKLSHSLFEDLAIDSIDAVDCIIGLEREFGIEKLFETSGRRLKTVEDIVNFIKAGTPK